jgi:hypothetical protein
LLAKMGMLLAKMNILPAKIDILPEKNWHFASKNWDFCCARRKIGIEFSINVLIWEQKIMFYGCVVPWEVLRICEMIL